MTKRAIVGVSFRPEVLDAARTEAARQSRTLSNYVRYLVEQDLRREEAEVQMAAAPAPAKREATDDIQ